MSNSYFLFITIAIIVFVLAVPYLVLKAGFKGAHMMNAKEKTIELRDLPKDQREIAKE